MEVWGLIFGIAGTIGGFGWNIFNHFDQRARPKVRLVYGFEYGANGPVQIRQIRDNFIAVDALREFQKSPISNDSKLLAGLAVVNKGRAPLFIDGLDLRGEKDGGGQVNGHLAFEGPPTMPDQVPPGGRKIYFISLDAVRSHYDSVAKHLGYAERIVLEVWSGDKEWATEPIPHEIVALAKSRN